MLSLGIYLHHRSTKFGAWTMLTARSSHVLWDGSFFWNGACAKARSLRPVDIPGLTEKQEGRIGTYTCQGVWRLHLHRSTFYFSASTLQEPQLIMEDLQFCRICKESLCSWAEMRALFDRLLVAKRQTDSCTYACEIKRKIQNLISCQSCALYEVEPRLPSNGEQQSWTQNQNVLYLWEKVCWSMTS